MFMLLCLLCYLLRVQRGRLSLSAAEFNAEVAQLLVLIGRVKQLEFIFTRLLLAFRSKAKGLLSSNLALGLVNEVIESGLVSQGHAFH